MTNNEAINKIRFLLDVGGSDGFTSADKEALNMAINALSAEIDEPQKARCRAMNSAADWYEEQEYRERCGMPHEGESMPKQKISNADRIRQMTDEELAEMLDYDCMEDACDYCAREDDMNCGKGDVCKNGILEWLRKEADEDAGTD